MKCAGMISNCKSENITHIDSKGFIYCSTCGPIRKSSGVRTRKLTIAEALELKLGRQASHNELKAEVSRILQDAAIEKRG